MKVNNPELYAEPATPEHAEQICAHAQKHEKMESLLSRLVSAVEKGDLTPAERVAMVQEIRGIVKDARELKLKTFKTYELTIWSAEALVEDAFTGKYVRRLVREFETEQAFIAWAESEVKKGECFSFIVAR
jgi:hypothetical protein